MSLVRAAGLGLALALTACGPRQPTLVDFAEVRHNYRPQDYPGVLNVWTRHAKLVRDVGTVLEVWGTYESWDFRQAYIEAYTQVYNLTESARQALDAAQLDEAKKYYDFHVAAQSTNFRWNDLEREDSAWRVTLVDGTGADLRPREIRVLSRVPELFESQFFPYRTEFSRTYRIRFDRAEAERNGFAGPSTGRLTLRFASPMGRAELLWPSR